MGSNLYHVKVEKNYTTKLVDNWNGREHDDLSELEEEEIRVEDGFKVTVKKVQWAFDQVAKDFDSLKKAISAVKMAANLSSKFMIGNLVKVQLPDSLKAPFTIDNSEYETISEKVLKEEDLEEMQEEEFYAFYRMGHTWQFTTKPILEAPIKSNNKEGATVRGYAAYVIDQNLWEDEEFYTELMRLVGIEN